MKTLTIIIIYLCLSLMLQAQVSKTVDVTTPGSLKTMLTEDELATITDLTLTGTIDARDFKTMRDNMPLLAEADLNSVAIDGYSGHEGTHPDQTDYLIDEIPCCAFYSPTTGKGKTTLTNIILPSSTKVIGGGAFSGCSGLTFVTIPSSVITIGTCTFADCTGLTSIYCYGITPPNFMGYGDGGYGCRHPFYNVNLDACTLYIPYGTKPLYTSPDNGYWQGFKNTIEMHGYIFSSMSVHLEAKYSTASVDISSDVTWTVKADQSWITINPTSGTGNQTLKFSVEPNTSAALRTSKITISTEGIEPLSISIIQAGLPKIVTTSAGGLLSALTDEELKGIIDLSITGTMDARDFKILRDRMPILKYVDLAGVTIATYTGLDGTINGQHSYPANAIPDKAFYGRLGLESVLLPSNSTSIGVDAFNNCQGLTAIDIPASVTSIGNFAFSTCIKLTSVTIPPAVTSIEQGTFSECTSLTSITLPENLNTIGDWAFYQCWSLTSLTIPPSVKTIGSFAFFACTNLKSITLPENLNEIGDGAFSQCENLTLANLPSSITKIGEYAFNNCHDLTSLFIPPSMTQIEKGTFMGCSGLASVSIPPSLTSIGNEAFRNCVGLTSISLPASITSIGVQAFNSCIGLTSVSIPSSVTSIEDFIFYECTGLTSVTIPESVTTIGNRAFGECSKLTSLTIPSSVTSIEEAAFHNCTGLTSLTASSEKPIDLSSSANVFKGVDTSFCILYVPAGSKELYAEADQWKDFKNIVEMTTSIEGLQALAHFNCYPNPFNQQVTIEIQNPKHTKLTVDIYNLAGQRVKNLAIGNTAERLNLTWDGTNERSQQVKPGIYLCKMNERSYRLIYGSK